MIKRLLQALLLGHWVYVSAMDELRFPRRGLFLDVFGGRLNEATFVLAIDLPWKRWFLVDYNHAIGRFRPTAWVRVSACPLTPWWRGMQMDWAYGLSPNADVRTDRTRKVRLYLDTL